ncbi:MAG: CBS domain-containing protein, partial [Chloroflexota bacterium]
MQVKEVMSHEVVEIPADAPVAEALKLMGESRSPIIGVYEEGKLQGTLTEHDIATWQFKAGNDIATARVREIMRTGDECVTEDQEVEEVTKLMRKAQLPGMMVVKDNHAVGTVSLVDVATQAITAASDGQAISTAMPTRVFLQPIAAPSILG